MAYLDAEYFNGAAGACGLVKGNDLNHIGHGVTLLSLIFASDLMF